MEKPSFINLHTTEKRTVPTSASIIYSDDTLENLEITGWENATDEALIRTQMPESEILTSVPDSQTPDKFTTYRFPSQGRSDTVFVDKPFKVNGITYSAIIRKGIGTESSNIREKGEVFGTPATNTDKKSYGISTLAPLQEEVEIAKNWDNKRLRVRKPFKIYDLKTAFMKVGLTEMISLPFEEAQFASIVAYATRNPITFEDVVRFLRDAKTQDEQDLVTKSLLQTSGQFLSMTDDYNGNELFIEKMKSGEGESDWFKWLAETFGQQMMRKTTEGIFHGEMHRQNVYIGCEFGDLADFGMPEIYGNKKDYGSYKNAKELGKDKGLIHEIVEVVSQIVELKINFNLANNRKWNEDIPQLVENFISGMRCENPNLCREIVQKIRTEFLNRAHSDTCSVKGLWNVSELVFISDTDENPSSRPLRDGTPGKVAIFNDYMGKVFGEHILDESPEEIFLRIETNTASSASEIPDLIRNYSTIISNPNFTNNIASVFIEVAESITGSDISNPNNIYLKISEKLG